MRNTSEKNTGNNGMTILLLAQGKNSAYNRCSSKIADIDILSKITPDDEIYTVDINPLEYPCQLVNLADPIINKSDEYFDVTIDCGGGAGTLCYYRSNLFWIEIFRVTKNKHLGLIYLNFMGDKIKNTHIKYSRNHCNEMNDSIIKNSGVFRHSNKYVLDIIKYIKCQMADPNNLDKVKCIGKDKMEQFDNIIKKVYT